MIQKRNDLSVRRQCELLGVNRSGLYHKAKEQNEASRLLREEIMAKIDYWHTKMPAIGSRKIVGWNLTDTLDTVSALADVKDAVATYGVPAILNSDQGSQFTSEEYKAYLKGQHIRQSMDGKSR